VLLIGVSGLALSMLCFGLSKSFWPLVASRSIAGALNGNIGMFGSVLGEITDGSNMAQAFAFMPVTWAGGATIG
jgi:predicted MFS family arabinose efflux permease